MPNKLSSTDRKNMLATFYKRRHSAAKTPIPINISQNDNANDGSTSTTKHKAVQMSKSPGGTQSNHPSSSTKSDLRDMLPSTYKRPRSAVEAPIPRSISENRNADGCLTTKQRAVHMSNSSHCQNNNPSFPAKSFVGSLKNKSGADDRPGKITAPSVSRGSSPDLKEWNADCEKEGLLSNHKEGFPSGRSLFGCSKSMNGVEDRLGKQVTLSGNTTSNLDYSTPIKSNNFRSRASSKSEKQNDGSEGTNLSVSLTQVGQSFHPDFSPAQSVTGGLKKTNGVEDRHGRQVSSSLPRSGGSNDGGERVDSTEGPRKKLIPDDGGPVDVIMSTDEVRASRSRMEHAANNAASLMPVKPLHMSNSGACPTSHDTPSNILSGSVKYPENGPALEIIWKGGFEVLNLSHEMGLCEGFVARPAIKVSEKAYKFSKQIAGPLIFKLESRGELWPGIFQIRSPDWNDVALYFYPGKSERSKGKYADLLKYMEKNDLVLRSLMGHVEFLVFASKTMALDCQQLKRSSYFMWGVFRTLKGSKSRTLRH